MLLMSSGVAVWVAHFAAIYGVTALGCARGWHGMVLPAIGGATAVGAAAATAIIYLGLRRRERFESWMAAMIAAFALLAIVWEAIPALMVPVCT